MGGFVYRGGYRHRAVAANDTPNARSLGIRQCVDTDCRADMAYDLPDDAQGGF